MIDITFNGVSLSTNDTVELSGFPDVPDKKLYTAIHKKGDNYFLTEAKYWDIKNKPMRYEK